MPLLLKDIIRILRKCAGRFTPHPIRILLEFYIRMMYGYHQYASLKRTYQVENIFLQYYKGTGDVYLSSVYLKYCEESATGKEKMRNSIFVVNGGNARRVTELFGLENVTIVTLSEVKARSLVWISRFLGHEMLGIHFLHYVSDVPMYTNFLIFLAGLNGIGFMDLYRATVFQNKDFEPPAPKWSMDEEWARNFFKKNHLTVGKTVLIAPDASSIAEGPDERFWIWLARYFRQNGYSVCTNLSMPKDKPIAGTKGVFIPYKNLASFLSLGDFFIGYRSGLCDLIASIDCKKIILYPKSMWPIFGGLGVGSTLEVFSLNKMGIARDVIEIEFKESKWDKTIAEIVKVMD